MKKPAMDPADLALERARQLKAVQLPRSGGEGPPDTSAPEEEPSSTVEPAAADEPAKMVDEPPKEAKPERPPRKKQASAKEEKRWKTSVQLSRRHEKIVNEFVMHYRMQGLRPVSVNTIILAALDVLKQTPQLDEVVHAIVAAPLSMPTLAATRSKLRVVARPKGAWMSARLRSLLVLAIAPLDESFFFPVAGDPSGSLCAR
jgi:outer membrane biosynthesis protein TonB